MVHKTRLALAVAVFISGPSYAQIVAGAGKVSVRVQAMMPLCRTPQAAANLTRGAFSFIPSEPPSSYVLVSNAAAAISAKLCRYAEQDRCFGAEIGDSVALFALPVTDKKTKKTWYFNTVFAGHMTGIHMILRCRE